MWKLPWYYCSPACVLSAWWLCGGANVDLLQEDLHYTLYLPSMCSQRPCSRGRTLLTHVSIGGDTQTLKGDTQTLKPQTCQRLLEGSNKTCMYQDPEISQRLSTTCLYWLTSKQSSISIQFIFLLSWSLQRKWLISILWPHYFLCILLLPHLTNLFISTFISLCSVKWVQTVTQQVFNENFP